MTKKDSSARYYLYKCFFRFWLGNPLGFQTLSLVACSSKLGKSVKRCFRLMFEFPGRKAKTVTSPCESKEMLWAHQIRHSKPPYTKSLKTNRGQQSGACARQKSMSSMPLAFSFLRSAVRGVTLRNWSLKLVLPLRWTRSSESDSRGPEYVSFDARQA